MGNGYRHTGFTLQTLYEDKPVLPWGNPPTGVSIVLPKDSVAVVCGGQKNAADSKAMAGPLAKNTWQHLLYTHQAGVGKLYINGELVEQISGPPYQHSEMSFIVGIQAELAPINQWWNSFRWMATLGIWCYSPEL